MGRPTLEEQLIASKLTDEECIRLLVPHGIRGIDFWLFNHLNFVWRVIHWNWFEFGD